jgi:AcrR family transcriptional regulator
MNPREKEKRMKKEDAILKAAIELFAEKGYSATSMKAIGITAGVNRATLYSYFKSKKLLFLGIHKKYIHEIFESYLGKAASFNDPKERFDFMIREYTKLICHQPELRILIHGSLVKDPDFREIKREWQKHYFLLRQTILQLQEANEIAPALNGSWMALLLLGMMTWITFWFDFRRDGQINDLAECALMLARGLERKGPPIIGEKSGLR